MNFITVRNAMLKRADDITVNKGDTLGGISKRTGHSLEQLMNWNDITDANKIKAGQVLKTYPGQWKMQPGGTLSGVGKQLGYTGQQMIDANKDLKPESIQAGQLIRLPQATTTPAKPAAQPATKPATKPIVPSKPAVVAKKTTYTPPANEYPDKKSALEIIWGKESAYGDKKYIGKNKSSSAEGHTQITDGTWDYITAPNKRPDLVANGETKANLQDKDYAFKVSGAYIDDLAARFYKVNGRWPTMSELLAAYNGGLAGRNTTGAQTYSREAMSKKYYTDRKLRIPAYVQEHGTD